MIRVSGDLTVEKTHICPVCETVQSRENEHCEDCESALIVGERYALVRLLGGGGQSRVYAALDGETGQRVAIKILSLSRVRDHKSLELFRRAYKVLAGLDHPGVPKAYGYFEDRRPTAALFGLVHELIEGQTLAEHLEQGARFDERSASRIARALLDILSHLHGLSPPVIHRDIKPSNIIQRPDGSLVLIDFGLVRDVMHPEGGSTMTGGTPGYTPTEQYVGEASPGTDLYALGATLVALLSRKEPLQMRPAGTNRLAFHDHIQVSASFKALLERMLEPDVRRRLSSAEEALAALSAPPRPQRAAHPAPAPLVLSDRGTRKLALFAVAVFAVPIGFHLLLGVYIESQRKRRGAQSASGALDLHSAPPKEPEAP